MKTVHVRLQTAHTTHHASPVSVSSPVLLPAISSGLRIPSIVPEPTRSRRQFPSHQDPDPDCAPQAIGRALSSLFCCLLLLLLPSLAHLGGESQPNPPPFRSLDPTNRRSEARPSNPASRFSTTHQPKHLPNTPPINHRRGYAPYKTSPWPRTRCNSRIVRCLGAAPRATSRPPLTSTRAGRPVRSLYHPPPERGPLVSRAYLLPS